MDLREVTDRELVDAFIASQQRSQFLQSWAWGEFQRSIGRPVLRLGLFEGGVLKGYAQVIIHQLPLGNCYWYVPRGPVEKFKDQRLKIKMYEGLVERARQAGAVFLRFEPAYPGHEFDGSSPQARRVRPIQPADTLYLDLSLSEEELQKRMHEKTRYNIRLAQKKGVSVRRGAKADLDHFWKINQETTSRDRFHSHAREYYEMMFARLPEKMVHLYLAEFEKEVIAANIVMHFGDTATYLHGASSNVSRNVMAPHLLQWRQIQDAKRAGFRWYDFWGIVPSRSAVGGSAVGPSAVGFSAVHKSVEQHTADKPTAAKLMADRHIADKLMADKHPWAGITRFKKGFGGEEAHYTGTFDIPLRPIFYKTYSFMRRMR